MLTFSSLGYTSSISGTDVFEAYLEYRYGQSVCTAFDHNLTQTSFDGKARLSGQAWGFGTKNGSPSGAQPLGSIPSLTLTVVDSTFDTVQSTGSCDMTGSFAVQTQWTVTFIDDTDTFIESLTFGTVTAAMATVHWGEFSLVNSSSVTGECSADYETLPGPASQTASSANFTLLRTGNCPV